VNYRKSVQGVTAIQSGSRRDPLKNAPARVPLVRDEPLQVKFRLSRRRDIPGPGGPRHRLVVQGQHPDRVARASDPDADIVCRHRSQYRPTGPTGMVGLVTDLNIAPGGSASVHVLHEGYVGRDGDDERVAGTVTLIIDGTAVIVVDPGMVASRAALLAALAGHGPQATDVTDVVFSHHHPDHTVNAALFPAARIHDHWAIYAGDRWIDRDADGAELAPSVRLLRTPGHTAQDISTVASTPEDVFACTHAWWTAGGPADDPLGSDAAALHVSRDLLLSFATVIVPGHGAAFRPDPSTPR
jgi:glyoxylase-like metal-dependent hydrolase (beta-lactamase superfamily II)